VYKRQLLECAEWAAANGFNLLQLLPINETGGDNSPYNAISSRAINPLTLDITPGALRDLPVDAAQTILKKHPPAAAGLYVDYEAMKRLNTAMLRAAFDAFHRHAARDRSEEFAIFQKATADWLRPYTLFRALMARHSTEQWTLWPPECRNFKAAEHWLDSISPKERSAIEHDRAFFAYVQWIAHQQWDRVRAACEKLGVMLMGDIPFGVNYHSADVFAEPELFDLEWFGGAPPEPYFKDDLFTQRWGQNWGIPLYDWQKMRADHYAWWRRRVRGVTRYFHAFRVDHILGFYRIYSFPWAPQRNAEFTTLSPEEAAQRTGGKLPMFSPRDDWSPDRAELNRIEGDERLRMLLDAAGDALVVGEDLGVVPDYVRPHLQSLGIAGIKIPIWEKRHDGRLTPGSEYPALSLATYGTHDHEPLHALWERFLHECRNGEEHNESWWALLHLAEFAGIDPAQVREPFVEKILPHLLAALHRSSSAIVIYMITDLLGLKDRFNVPGSVSRKNWALRLPEPPCKWPAPVFMS
jgi:4-alpha-glucanotransferase